MKSVLKLPVGVGNFEDIRTEDKVIFSAGDPERIGRMFTDYLKQTISIRDTAVSYVMN